MPASSFDEAPIGFIAFAIKLGEVSIFKSIRRLSLSSHTRTQQTLRYFMYVRPSRAILCESFQTLTNNAVVYAKDESNLADIGRDLEHSARIFDCDIRASNIAWCLFVECVYRYSCWHIIQDQKATSIARYDLLMSISHLCNSLIRPDTVCYGSWPKLEGFFSYGQWSFQQGANAMVVYW